MTKIVVYTKENCPYCDWAKKLLNTKQLKFEEIRVDLLPDKLAEMIHRSGRRSVPQIFINDEAIGGYDDLSALVKTGKLDQLLV